MNVVENEDTKAALARLVTEIQQVSLTEEFSDDILTHYVESTVDDARYWQPPDEEEGVLRQPEVRAALLPVAQGVGTGVHPG